MDYKLVSSPLYELLLNGRSHRLPKGQVLQSFDSNISLSLVVKGFVKRYAITNDGSQSIQSIYGPGEVFPLTPAYKLLLGLDIYKGNEVFYYEAMTPLILNSVKDETLKENVEKSPIIYKDLFYVAGQRLSSNIQKLENTSLRAANRKVAHQLYYYSKKYGEPTDEGILITAPLTHQNIASILNLARETVTHCMTRLQEKGIISASKNILVLDQDKLLKEVH